MGIRQVAWEYFLYFNFKNHDKFFLCSVKPFGVRVYMIRTHARLRLVGSLIIPVKPPLSPPCALPYTVFL